MLNKLKQNYYFIFIFILCLTPLLWFLKKGNVLIDGVDTNFPLNPLVWFSRRFFVWSDISNAGADFSSSISGMFFHFIQIVPYVLGLSLKAVELISLIFWFAVIIFSSNFLAGVLFGKRLVARLLFIVFYSFNIYLFNTWENVKVSNIALVAAIPLGLGVLMFLERKAISRSKAFILAALCGIILAGSGINPAYFIVFFIVLVIYFTTQILSNHNFSALKRNLSNLLLFASVIILVNLYWILPTLIHILKDVPASGSIGGIGFTDWLDSLSAHASILNILRLQGAWDWYLFDSYGVPIYIPYVVNYFNKLPFIVFSFLAPSLSLLSLIFIDKKKKGLYLFFFTLLILGVFLGVGTHDPTGGLFKWMVYHLPFFSLFRSPWYIFTPLLTLAYASFIGLLYMKLADSELFLRSKFYSSVLSVLGFALIAANLVYCYPLVTGKIFRPSRQEGFYIKFPGYVFDAGEWISQRGEGRVVGFPDDNIENFDWGYRGIESILSLISSKETIFSSLNSIDAPISNVIKEFYSEFKKDRLTAAFSLANKLNIDYLFLKNDQISLFKNLPKSFLDSPEAVFGEWGFYKLANNDSKKIYTSSLVNFLFPDGDFMGFPVSGKADVLNPNDKVIAKIPSIDKVTGKVILAANSQKQDFERYANNDPEASNIFSQRDFSKVVYSFWITENGNYKLVLDKNGLNDFGVNYRSGLLVTLDSEKQTLVYLTEDDSFVYFSPMYFPKGDNNISFNVNTHNLVGPISSGDLNVKDNKAIYDLNNYLTIENMSKKDASSTFSIKHIDPFSPYYIEFSYKQFYGSTAKISVVQFTQSAIINIFSQDLPNYPDWNKVSFYYNPINAPSNLDIMLTALQMATPLGTKIAYNDLRVGKIFTNNLYLVKDAENNSSLAAPQVSYKKDSPVLYSGEIQNSKSPFFLVFSENYTKDWKISLYNENSQKIGFNPLHFSVNAYANGWYIDLPEGSYKFKIYYAPQQLFKIGASISLLTVFSLILFSTWKKYKAGK